MSPSARNAVLDDAQSELVGARTVLFDTDGNEVCAVACGDPLTVTRVCAVDRVEVQNSSGAWLVRIWPPEVPRQMAEGDVIDLDQWAASVGLP